MEQSKSTLSLYEQTSDTNENNKTCKAGRVTPKYCL